MIDVIDVFLLLNTILGSIFTYYYSRTRLFFLFILEKMKK